MRHLIFLLLNLFVSISLFSQHIPEPDARLFLKYSDVEIQELLQNNPSIIALRNFELESGYFISDFEDGKLSDLSELKYYDYQNKIEGDLVHSIEESNFNLYEYKYKRLYKERTYYRVTGTSRVVVIISSQEMLNKFNETYDYE